MTTPTANTTATARTSLTAEHLGVDARLVDTTLAFTAGSITVVVGENGAGKSTLLDALAGVIAPTSGRVLLGGVDIGAMVPRDRARKIASLGQTSIDALDLSAAERIAQGLVPRRGSHALVDAAAHASIEAVATALGVAHLLARPLLALSTGERRRVEVARALVDDRAEVVLVDEPHAGVDVRHQSLVSAALRARAATGAVVVASVHDLGVGVALADRVVGLREGSVVVDGPVADALNADAVERLYGVSGAVVVREGAAVGVLLPR